MNDLEAELADLRRGGLYRQLRVIDRVRGPWVTLDGREVLLMCSNDYLGLAGHPAVRAAAAEAAQRWGAGTGASRLISGNLALHHELEHELADYKGYPSCLLFGSGFLANVGVIPALMSDGVILSDALNHASIVEGCRLSRADTVVYSHADLDSLAWELERWRGRPAMVVTDAVFSMDGDVAPLEAIVDLAARFGARVLVDEAHATGVIGPGGRGLVAALGLQDQVDVVVGTLSKALGSYGAFACCRSPVAELLVNRARTLIYSTGLPASAVAAARTALDIVRTDPELVPRLWRNASLLRSGLAAAGFDVAEGEMPIVPLIVGEPGETMELCEALVRRGIFVQAIRPPTVPDGTSRLRLVAMASHAVQDIQAAVAQLSDCRKLASSSSSIE